MKPSVANRNMPAAMNPRPPVERPMVATSTIEPRLPSIGIAFIRTPLAPSFGSSCGGGCSTIWPVGTSGASRRVPRSVVVTCCPYPCDTGLTPPKCGEGDGVADTLAHPHQLAVSVHGPAGVLDLVVPPGATAADLAEEYARQSGMPAVPDLH